MLIGLRGRVGAALSAAVCALVSTVALVAAAPENADAAPAYNPGFIAFGTGRTPGWTVVDAAAEQQRTITPAGGGFDASSMDVTQVEYSPNARWAAFVTGSPGGVGAGQLWVASADGTGARLIADAAVGPVAWSPDGTRILFASNGIQSVPAGGGSPAEVVPPPAEGRCRLGGPLRVTSHNAVFYWQYCEEEGGRITAREMFADRPGGTSRPVVALNASGSVFAVSPDGSRLAEVEQSYEISVIVHHIGSTNQVNYYYSAAYSVVGIGAVAFGPSGGDIAVAYQRRDGGQYYDTIQVFANQPYPTPRTIVSVPVAGYEQAISFLDWVNGSSNLPERPTADRIGGADRVATAISASRWTYDDRGLPGRQAAVAVLSRADSYPDSLAGTALATEEGGPLLLTPGGGLDPGVGSELTRILPPGATVYLLGGPAALSPAVTDQVRKLGYNPVRLGGSDRYATAVAVATAVSGTSPAAVLLATGIAFPDALTAGAAAGQERYCQYGNDPCGGVVLLTAGTTMPPSTLAYLTGLVPRPPLYAVGGPAAAAMRSVTGSVGTWTALVGSDRYDTAAKVATSALYGNGAPGRYTMAAITTGTDFPDAMSGGALAGFQDAPLLLAGPGGLSPAENAILNTLNAGHLSDIAVIGGPAAVSNRVLAIAADTAFGPHTWDSYINRLAPPLP